MSGSSSQDKTAFVPPLLGANDPPPFTVYNPDGKAKCLIICEHACNTVPEKLGTLGLAPEELAEHVAWDIGAGSVTRQLSEIINAPALAANYSRLVIDPNRQLDHPTTFVMGKDGKPIPANASMGEAEKLCRINEIYSPYHEALEAALDKFEASGTIPVVLSVHSFTQSFFNQVRPWEIGILWVQDQRVPQLAIEFFKKKGLTVGDNQPYDARVMRGSAINRHADGRLLPNMLVEIRNDLIADEKGCKEWAALLGECMSEILSNQDMHSLYDGPLPAYDPEEAKAYFDKLIEKAKRGEL